MLVTVTATGFHKSSSDWYLGASPDEAVYHSYNTSQPFEFLEFNVCRTTLMNACSLSNFLNMTTKYADGNQEMALHINHQYYAHKYRDRWHCDSVACKLRGNNVQRIAYDSNYWEKLDWEHL